MNSIFEGLTFKEITIQLLIDGFLTVSQVLAFRIEFENRILNTINVN